MPYGADGRVTCRALRRDNETRSTDNCTSTALRPSICPESSLPGTTTGLRIVCCGRCFTTVAHHHAPGDIIWVHDYQLMLLPGLLRARLPTARIGFFLHIPFPSSEVFRALPWRREILHGLLGADVIGVHTFAYMRHFLASLCTSRVSRQTSIDCTSMGVR
jgi:hypothetical protein